MRRVSPGVQGGTTGVNNDAHGVVCILLMLRFIVEVHDGVTKYLLVDRNSDTLSRWDTTQSIGEAVLDSLHVRDVEVIFGKAQALPGQ